MLRTLSIIVIALLTLSSFATKDIHSSYDPYEVRFITKEGVKLDPVFQSEIRHAAAWSGFTAAHSGWLAQFDEDNQKPMRAFGPGISVNGADPQEKAINFITNELAAFDIPLADLSLVTITDNGKHHQVFFSQEYNGLEVMYSNAMVKMTHDGRVISWAAIVHNDIAINTEPILSPLSAAQFATAGMEGVTDMEVLPELKILSVPGHRSYTHHLVYEVEIDLERENGIPSKYIAQVDAINGEVLQRIDQYHTFCNAHSDPEKKCNQASGPSEPVLPVVNATFTANTIIYDPSEPSEIIAYPSMRVVIDGQNLTTDEAGALISSATGPIDATIYMEGEYADVRASNNGVTPSAVVSLLEGGNEVSMTNLFTDVELCAYANTTIIHDYMKSVLPDYDGMDFAMPIDINITPHDCNAFYDGNSINFYVGAFDCVSLVTVSDVVFHEYGHGINDNFYADQSSNFNNGGMGEGYSDVWAYFVYEDPILGDGNNPQLPDDYIRRYDMDPKVYPQDLVGQVHADGEIIAGAWWDTYALLGNDIATTTDLWRMAYYGLQATASNGSEGMAFLNVLIDVLESDDDDGNILNGTPNGAAITEGFAMHGITFLATAEIDHEEILEVVGNEPIVVDADLNISTQFTEYLEGVSLYYRLSNSTTWLEQDMNDLGSNQYQGIIPAQPAGTIVAYYLGVNDVFDNLSSVTPVGAQVEDPTLPNFILIGYDHLATYDSDEYDDVSFFNQGLPSDNAETGAWEEAEPIGSFQNGNEVAPNSQSTEDGEFCFVTGNSFNVNDGIGINDVDAGTTTLISDEIDITDFTDPAFTYMRWYTNATGANPRADWWQVQVSSNGGNTWVKVEETKMSDASWRRNAFRISDYVPITDEFMIKFNASDSLRPGTNLEGGSLVEAALDDFKLYGSLGNVDAIDEIIIASSIALYPIPAQDELTLSFELVKASELRIRVINALGQVVTEEQLGRRQGSVNHPIMVASLSPGMYSLEIITQGGTRTEKFQVE